MVVLLLAAAFVVGIAIAETRGPAKARAASLGGPMAGQQYWYNLQWWLPLFQNYGGRVGIPGEVMVEWIREESEGNPVAVGNPREAVADNLGGHYPREMGIFQLYNPDDFVTAGQTPASYRAYAKPGFPYSQEMSRPLNTDEAMAQVEGGVRLIQRNEGIANRIMGGYGLHWQGYDYWSYVKLIHGLPGLAGSGMNAVVHKLGRGPASFTEFRRTVMSFDLTSETPPTGFDTTTWSYRGKFGSILANADRVGRAAGTPTV